MTVQVPADHCVVVHGVVDHCAAWALALGLALGVGRLRAALLAAAESAPPT